MSDFWQAEIEQIRRDAEARIEQLTRDLESAERRNDRQAWVLESAREFLADDGFRPISVPELVAEIGELLDRFEAEKTLTADQAKAVIEGVNRIRRGQRTGAATTTRRMT